MTYTFGKEEEKTIPCPFCGKMGIRYHYRPSFKRSNTSSTVGGKKAKTASRTGKIEEVLNDCPFCGAKRKDIQKKIDNPSPPASKEDVIKRLKEAGLPTKI